jgi:uncharacterized protein YndB with AHSA1/START domain
MELLHTFSAPRSIGWQAWTEVDELQQWWGPRHFTSPRCEIDLRPGGLIHIDMRAPDCVVYPMSGAFEEIVPPERLVFLISAVDEQGEAIFVNRNRPLPRSGSRNRTLDPHCCPPDNASCHAIPQRHARVLERQSQQISRLSQSPLITNLVYTRRGAGSHLQRSRFHVSMKCSA